MGRIESTVCKKQGSYVQAAIELVIFGATTLIRVNVLHEADSEGARGHREQAEIVM